MLLQADARALPLADASAQCVITSPPYFGLRDYVVGRPHGLEPTPELYVAHMVAVFREIRRVLCDDGVVWCNLGDAFQASNSSACRGASPSRSRPTAGICAPT